MAEPVVINFDELLNDTERKRRARLIKQGLRNAAARPPRKQTATTASSKTAEVVPVEPQSSIANLGLGGGIGFLSNIIGIPGDIVQFARDTGRVLSAGARGIARELQNPIPDLNRGAALEASDELAREVRPVPLSSAWLEEKATGALPPQIREDVLFNLGLAGGGLLAAVLGGYKPKEPSPSQLTAIEKIEKGLAKYMKRKPQKPLLTAEQEALDGSRIGEVLETLDKAEPVPQPKGWSMTITPAPGPTPKKLDSVAAKAVQIMRDAIEKRGELIAEDAAKRKKPRKTPPAAEWLRGKTVKQAQADLASGVPVNEPIQIVAKQPPTVTTPEMIERYVDAITRMNLTNRVTQPEMDIWYPEGRRLVAALSGGDPEEAQRLARLLSATSGRKSVAKSFETTADIYLGGLLSDPEVITNADMATFLPGIVSAYFKNKLPVTEKFHPFGLKLDPNLGLRYGRQSDIFTGTVNDTHMAQIYDALNRGALIVDPVTKKIILTGLFRNVKQPSAQMHKLLDAAHLAAAKALNDYDEAVQARGWGEKILLSKKGKRKTLDEELAARIASMAMPSDLAYTTTFKAVNEFIPLKSQYSNIAELPYSLRQQFTREMEEAFAGERRRDALLDVLNYPGNVSGHGIGVWEPEGGPIEFNPTVVTSMLASFDKKNDLTPQFRRFFERIYAPLRGLLTEQGAIAGSAIRPKGTPRGGLLVRLDPNYRLTDVGVKDILGAIEQYNAKKTTKVKIPTGLSDFGDSTFVITDFATEPTIPYGRLTRSVKSLLTNLGLPVREVSAVGRPGAYVPLPWNESTPGSGKVTEAVLSLLQSEPGAVEYLNKEGPTKALARVAARLAEAREKWANKPGVRLRTDVTKLLRDISSPEAISEGVIEYMKKRLADAADRPFWPVVAVPIIGSWYAQSEDENLW